MLTALAISVTFISVSISNVLHRDVNNKVFTSLPPHHETTYISHRKIWRPTQLQQREQEDPHLICTPDGSRNAKIIGRATDADGDEHVLWTYQRSKPGHTETGGHFSIEVTTLLAQSVCGTSYSPFVDAAITNRIELNTARALTLQSYQHDIDEAGSFDSFKSQFLENLRQRNFHPFDKPSFTSVDVWAWQQINLEVPSDQYALKNIDHSYQYNSNGSIKTKEIKP